MPRRLNARIYRPTPRNLARLAAALKRGELVGVPTETVYGLAANALDATACKRIFHAKGRPSRDPLIVHICRAEDLDLVAQPNAEALRLTREFWPGPLTFVLRKREIIPDVVTAGQPTVAVRMPAHPVFQRLLQLTDVPLAAPSANPFGYVSPTTAEHVVHGLGREIRHVLDGGPCAIGIESTIVDLRDPQHPRLLRPGAITREQLERVLGRSVIQSRPKKGGKPLIAPGTMKRHYSPRTPVILHDCLPTVRNQGDAWVSVARPHGKTKQQNSFWLDARGELRGVARRLFALLRALDNQGFRRIHVERVRGAGLAHAINDRLSRAAAR